MNSVTLKNETGGCVCIDGDPPTGLYLVDGRLYLRCRGKRGKTSWRDCETGERRTDFFNRRTGYKMVLDMETTP